MFTIDPNSTVPKERQVADELDKMVVGETRDFAGSVHIFRVLDRAAYVYGEKGIFITATIKGGKRVTRTR